MASIGIDLGTTYSCVAVWRNDRVEIIPNDQGNRTTPSYVAFLDSEVLTGDAAKNQVAMKPKNTLFDSKRLIGRRFSDAIVQSDIKLWPFRVVSNGNDKPIVVVQVNGKEKLVSPEQVSSMVLVKMKETAERFLGRTVKNAVVTVPAYFNHSQREATKIACAMAGLNVLRIINEPTAAAIAYFLENRISIAGKRNVIVFDLGGGTLDVSLVRVGEGKFEVFATAGDTHLGGEDFDNMLLSYFVDEIMRKQRRDIRGDMRKLRMIRTACERAKRALSFQSKTRVDIDFFFDDINYTIVRAKFEELCSDLFRKCLEPVKQCLSDSKMDKSQVHEVVLVGGSSRIPMIQRLLKDFFNGKELNMTVNCDEAVAYGAAVQAAILSGEGNQVIQDFTLIDVAPLSLGTDLIGGIMDVLIRRNTVIPTKKEKIYYTCCDNQTKMTIKIYEGEGLRLMRNNLLGSFELNGITPAPSGVSQVIICFEMDANGILNVTAENSNGGARSKLSITKDEGASKTVIDNIVKEGEKFRIEDEQLNDKVMKLLKYTDDMKSNIMDTMGGKLDQEHEKEIDEAVIETVDWLAREELSVAEIDAKKKKLENLCNKFSLLGNKIVENLK